jgi:ABC-type Fe3+-hydroxamate transport system substrate-binding protein
MGAENTSQQQKTAEVFWSRFSNLPAVANGRIYVIESDAVLRLGPRLAEGVEAIANCLHPGIFQFNQKPTTENAD